MSSGTYKQGTGSTPITGVAKRGALRGILEALLALYKDVEEDFANAHTFPGSKYHDREDVMLTDGRSYGICAAITHFYLDEKKHAAWHKVRAELFYSWPHYSGEYLYPVPGVGGDSPEAAYESCTDVWVGEYGALRMDLLTYMIATVQAEVQ